MSWIEELVTAITSTFTKLGNAVFTFLKDGFVTLFFDKTAEGVIEGVSDFGIFAFVLMGVSLCLGLTYYIVNLVRRKI